MSDNSRAVSHTLADKMDRMVNEALTEFEGGMCVAYTCLVQFVDEQGERKFTFFVSDGQAAMTTAGHIRYMDKIVDLQMDHTLRQGE